MLETRRRKARRQVRYGKEGEGREPAERKPVRHDERASPSPERKGKIARRSGRRRVAKVSGFYVNIWIADINRDPN